MIMVGNIINRWGTAGFNTYINIVASGNNNDNTNDSNLFLENTTVKTIPRIFKIMNAADPMEDRAK